MEKLRPENEIENFKLPHENRAKDLSNEEIRLAELYIKERNLNKTETDKPLTEDEIKNILSEKSATEEETASFLNNLKKLDNNKINRRNLLKIGAVAAGYLVFRKDIDELWAEFKEEKENNYEIEYSKKMTAFYDEVKNLPIKEAKKEDIEKNIKEIEKSFEFIKFIKNSEKINFENLADILAKSEADAILFGEMHDPETNGNNAKIILEKFKNKSNKRIAKICLEYLDFNDPRSVELTNKFNQKQISAEFFHKELGLLKNTLPLLKFARENNILVDGLEDREKTDPMKNPEKNIEENVLNRFTIMSHRLGEIVKNKKNDEIIIAYSGSLHTERKEWNSSNVPKNYLCSLKPIEWDLEETVNKQGDEKDYTFKEYLEKNGLKTETVHLLDTELLSRVNSHASGYTYNWLGEIEAKKLSERWKKDWENYKTKSRTPFSVKSDKNKSYFALNPSEIPEDSPVLTVFETIKKNHPVLHKIIKNKKYVDYQPIGYNMNLVSQTKNGISAKMADINLKSGKIKKLYLPEQLKNK